MTGTELYLSALDLLALRGEGEGTPCDTLDLKARAISLINILLTETAYLSSIFDGNRHDSTSIDDLQDTLPCADFVASAILPYGLASLLAMGEDDALSDRLHKLYSNARLSLANFNKARIHPITEVYR